MVAKIQSIHNDKVKYLRKLYRTRYRKRQKKLVLEGYRIIRAALNLAAKPELIFMTEEFADGKQGSEIIELLPDRDVINIITPDLLTDIADTVNPQGIIAVIDEPEYELEALKQNAERILILDGIQDPGNAGTLIRTALAAGFDGILALKGTVDIYNLKVIRATAGALFNIPLVYNCQLTEITNLKEGGFKVVGADPAGESYHYQHDYNYPLLLVVGNEARGISEEVRQLTDYRVKIPLVGEIDSLNAAVAGSILMYEVMVNNWQKKMPSGSD